MGRLLLNLRHVPEDEADDVRAMLEEADIEYYETPPNRWGITMGGIWVRSADDLPRAKALMADYQMERRARVLADREARRQSGELETFWDSLRKKPVLYLGALATVVFIVYLMLYPFMQLGA
ncbi:hypothetical protein J2T60_001050 [Natronospira proteinivora]|uniref:Signal transducing protein n=1 Tax=Natronospira proteinivora TaxID=1807133 RepID=A0ABT1G717_9GAMM|nr:DUF6164 family protein [Natronospira proteinivora]MCP1727085.1 hypothetical protein [Natronospira proteinivora]